MASCQVWQSTEDVCQERKLAGKLAGDTIWTEWELSTSQFPFVYNKKMYLKSTALILFEHRVQAIVTGQMIQMITCLFSASFVFGQLHAPYRARKTSTYIIDVTGYLH